MLNSDLTITNEAVKEISYNDDPVEELRYGRDKVWPNKFVEGFIKFDSPDMNEITVTTPNNSRIITLYSSVNDGPWLVVESESETFKFGGLLGSLRLHGEVVDMDSVTYGIIGFKQGSGKTGSPITVSGTLLSLYFANVVENDTRTMCAKGLFFNVPDISDASGLKMPICFGMDEACYRMFASTYLINPPELPAKALASGCYREMFMNCQLLEKAPELPATSVTEYCYTGMFYGCSSLTEAPSKLPATVLAAACYNSMFHDCPLLKLPPEMKFSIAASNSCGGMFANCISLTTPPNLDARIIQTGCYYSMFYGCENLETVPDLPATTAQASCYGRMFYGCKKIESAKICLKNLEERSLDETFTNCSKLKKIEVDFTTWTGWYTSGYTSHHFNTEDWVKGVSASGTFIKPSNLADVKDVDHVPSGWTVVNK